MATLTAARAGQRFGVLDIEEKETVVAFREKAWMMDQESMLDTWF